MLRILPCVTEQACFALKGGTAINLFIRDMGALHAWASRHTMNPDGISYLDMADAY